MLEIKCGKNVLKTITYDEKDIYVINFIIYNLYIKKNLK